MGWQGTYQVSSPGVLNQVDVRAAIKEKVTIRADQPDSYPSAKNAEIRG